MGSDNLHDLGAKIAAIQEAERQKSKKATVTENNAESMSRGIRAGAELVAPILGGCFIGWLIDGWLGTKPGFLIGMLILGVITGFVNVWRLTQSGNSDPGFSQLHIKQKNDKSLPD